MKKVLMLAYTHYPCDTRIRREAETLVRHGSRVTMLALMEGASPRTYDLNGVTVIELKAGKYRGGSAASYMRSYLQFLVPAFTACLAASSGRSRCRPCAQHAELPCLCRHYAQALR
jgi:hypothetical protein